MQKEGSEKNLLSMHYCSPKGFGATILSSGAAGAGPGFIGSLCPGPCTGSDESGSETAGEDETGTVVAGCAAEEVVCAAEVVGAAVVVGETGVVDDA